MFNNWWSNFMEDPMEFFFNLFFGIVLFLIASGFVLLMVSLVVSAVTYTPPTPEETRMNIENCRQGGATAVVDSKGRLDKCIYGPVRIN